MEFTYNTKHLIFILHNYCWKYVFIPLRQEWHFYSSAVCLGATRRGVLQRVTGRKHSFSEATIKWKSTQSTCFWGFVAGMRQLFLARNEAAAEQRTVRSCVRLGSTLVYCVMRRPQRVPAGLILMPVVFETLCTSFYSSAFCTNNAEVHRCTIYFSISGATTWTDDQIRLIAFICMFLLESSLWQEKRLFQTHTIIAKEQ